MAGENVVKVTVKISPAKMKLKAAKTAQGGKLSASWAKDARASGYQMQISTSKNFKKDVVTKDTSKASCAFAKLKAGKTYYVRIRSYKKAGAEKIYGAWSSVKNVGMAKK